MTAAEPAAPAPEPTWLVERYEELRKVSLAGRSEGPRLGLALLLRQGVSAWAAAWHGLAAPSPDVLPVPCPGAGTLPQSVVSQLASMALAASAPARL